MSSPHPSSLALPILGATFSRLLLNTARRLAYPFAPVLSRGLGVSLSAVTSLIAINQITAVLGALVGPWIDRLGYRRMMVAGMVMLSAGMLAAAWFPVYGVVLIALLLAGVGKSIFDPAVQAWAGARVPYHRRGLVVGILEVAWSASTLVGIPLVAVLIDRYGWRSPFLVIGGLSLVAAATLMVVIPPDAAPHRPGEARRAAYVGAYADVIGDPSAVGMLGYAFMVSMANDNLFVVYGAWLEQRFGLSIVALGLGTSLIGMAELAGEGVTAAVADRCGLKRALVVGLGLTTLGYWLLPLMDRSPAAALAGLALLFFVFEFSMVTSLSLCTEVLPGARATMMAAFLATAGLGRVAGALVGGAVWAAGGISATCWLSGGLTLGSLACLTIGLRRWQQPTR